MSTYRLVNNSSTSPGKVRDHILIAARREFSAHSYTAVALQQIARAAGVTKPMIHYYYGSKEGLFVAVLAHAAAQHRQYLSGQLGAGPPRVRDRMASLMEAQLEFAATQPGNAQLLLTATTGETGRIPAAAVAITQAHQERCWLRISNLFARADQGSPSPTADTSELSLLFRAVLDEATRQVLSADAPLHGTRHLARRLTDLLWHGFSDSLPETTH